MPTRAAMAEQGAAPTPASTAGALLPPKKKNISSEKLEAVSVCRSGEVGTWGRSGRASSWGHSGGMETLWAPWWALLRSGLWRALPRSGLSRVLPRAANGGCAGFAWAVNGSRLAEAANGGGLVLAQARTLPRNRKTPSLQLSPVVSGRSTGRW